jgi:hypothetical protein
VDVKNSEVLLHCDIEAGSRNIGVKRKGHC